jgi:hypothetical protein
MVFESKELSNLEGEEKPNHHEEIASPQISSVNAIASKYVVASRYDVTTTLRTEESADLIGSKIISI